MSLLVTSNVPGFSGEYTFFLLDGNFVAIWGFDGYGVCVVPVKIRNSTVVESVVNGVIPAFRKFKTAAGGPE